MGSLSPIAPHATFTERTATRADLVADARAALHATWSALRVPARIAVEVPPVSMTGVMSGVDGAAWLWLSPRGEQGVAFGERARATATGPDRWLALRGHAAAAFAAWPAHESAAHLPFRFAAGATFDDTTYDEVWSGHPSAWLVTPTVQVVRHDGRHWLVACASPNDSDALRTSVDRALDAVLAAPPVDAPRTPGHSGWEHRRDTPTGDGYRTLVAELTRAIAAGDLAKVVAARRVELGFRDPVDTSAVLQQLAFAYPECVRFAWRWQGEDDVWRTFLGATPERLVRIEGRDLESEALAGTIETDAAGDNERLLLESDKDRREHHMVVDHLRTVFGSATSALHIDETPGLRRLRNAVHLRTGVRGQLRDGVDVFDLLQRAHPTPAVGGLPVGAALQWIREREPTPRGAYAAPIGWVDQSGNAEFMVAIRSAVISERTATLFAGAGIVQASDPDGEWAETEVKLRALLEALGCA